MSNRPDPIAPHVRYVADQNHPDGLAPIAAPSGALHTRRTTVNLEWGTIDFISEAPGRKARGH